MNIQYFNEDEIVEKRERIIQEAKKLIGIPFRHMGVTRFGLDCKGCGYLAFHRAGIDLPQGDGKIYEPNWFFFVDKERYLESLSKYFEFTDCPLPGDIVVFRCFCNLITHGGVYIGNNEFIHAPSGRKVQKDDLTKKPWKNKFSGYMIYKGFLKNRL